MNLPAASRGEMWLFYTLREPFLNGKSATFLNLILSKFLGNANNTTPPRPAKNSRKNHC